MIVRLRGILIDKNIQRCIIDVHDVGYAVTVPLSTLYALPDCGEHVSLHIHMHVKEDGINLYGFGTERERELFGHLMTVSGIGPKQALTILSGVGVGDLLMAIKQGDASKLIAIPGIGRKTAQRLILELKDRLMDLYPTASNGEGRDEVARHEEVKQEVLSALVNLGYKTAVARSAIDHAYTSSSTLSPAVDWVLKEALRYLAGGVSSGS